MHRIGKAAPRIDQPRLYNSRIVQYWLQYLSENHPDLDQQRLLDEARIQQALVEDPLQWLTQTQVDRFHEHIDAHIDEPDLARKVGRFAVYNQRPTVLQQFGFGMIDPLTAYLSLRKITSQVTRGSNVILRKLSATQVEIINAPTGGAEEKPYQCDNRIGCYEGIARMFTRHYAQVEHPECWHLGGACCRYVVSWQSVTHRRWGWFRNLLIGATLIFGGGMMIYGLPHWTAKAGLPLAVLALIVAAVANRYEKKHIHAAIERQGRATRKLLHEIHLRHNSAVLIQEISSLTSWNLRISQVLEFVVHAVKIRLRPDRVMIVHHDHQAGGQAKIAQEGFADEQLDCILKVWKQRDHADEGPLDTMLKKRKPMLLQMAQGQSGNHASAGAGFMKQIDTMAFLCVPIVYEDRLLGFMAADYTGSRRYLTDIDLRLYQGVASQMAINIVNIASFRKIKLSEARFRLLADNVFDVIWSLDLAQKRFTYVSPSVTRMTGYTVEEVLAMPLEDVLPPESLKKASDRILNELASDQQTGADRERSTTIQLENNCKDGSRIWSEITATLVRDEEGKPIRILGITRDISERIASRREQERLQGQLERARKMEALGTLAGGVAHDLNNILAGVVSYPDLLLMQVSPDSPMVKPLKVILKSGERAAAIVQDLLTLARRGVPVTAPLNLNSIIKDYLASPEFEKMLSFHPQCEMITDLMEETSVVEGSEVHLAKTVMNLVSNAAEAMPDGGAIRVRTSLRELTSEHQGYEPIAPGHYVVLEVKDNGTGIAAEDLGHIFEPFYSKKVMGRSGTGLGMAVVWGTVKDHHGYVDIETQQGQGTEISLYFPVGDQAQYQTPAVETIDNYQGHGQSVLVVDDMKEQRDVSVAVLSELGYRATAMPSGEAAVEYMQDHSVDLILLDMVMDPGIDGLDTYRRIIEFHPGQKAIIASGYSETDRVLEARRLGVGLCVKKPFNMETIGRALHKVLSS